MKKAAISTIALYFVAGIAMGAGSTVWNDVLRFEIDRAVEGHGNQKKNNVIKFERRLSR